MIPTASSCVAAEEASENLVSALSAIKPERFGQTFIQVNEVQPPCILNLLVEGFLPFSHTEHRMYRGGNKEEFIPSIAL